MHGCVAVPQCCLLVSVDSELRASGFVGFGLAFRSRLILMPSATSTGQNIARLQALHVLGGACRIAGNVA